MAIVIIMHNVLLFMVQEDQETIFDEN